jgi:hypothetical protein
MSVESFPATAGALPAESDISAPALPTAAGELHAALGLSPNQDVHSYVPLIRQDYSKSGRRIGGALVIGCTVSEAGVDGTVSRDVVIDDAHRPLSEAMITRLGQQANDALAANPGSFIYRTDFSVE